MADSDNRSCKYCSSQSLTQSEVTFANGTKHTEERCSSCGKHLRYVQREGDPLMFVMPFGKHSGKTLGVIWQTDPEYVIWCANQNGMSKSIRRRCTQILQDQK